MGFFNRFKKKDAAEKKSAEDGSSSGGKSEVKKEEVKKPKAKPVEKSEVKKTERLAIKPEAKPGEIKGKTRQAYQVLIKPLVTEKAGDIGALGKYVFAINPGMNKVEVKKAIRTIYNVEPTKVNIANFSGKKVRYGRVKGKTKSWKKAIVTLKPGDKIEVYEGV